MTLEEARALVAACAGAGPLELRDRAICVLGLRAGLRRHALCNAQISGLTVREGHAELRYEAFEDDSGADVDLDDETRNAIQAWLSWLASSSRDGADNYIEGYLFRGLTRERVDGSRAITIRLTEDGLYEAIKRRASRAGIEQFHPDLFVTTHAALSKDGAIPPLVNP